MFVCGFLAHKRMVQCWYKFFFERGFFPKSNDYYQQSYDYVSDAATDKICELKIFVEKKICIKKCKPQNLLKENYLT